MDVALEFRIPCGSPTILDSHLTQARAGGINLKPAPRPWWGERMREETYSRARRWEPSAMAPRDRDSEPLRTRGPNPEAGDPMKALQWPRTIWVGTVKAEE